MKLRHESYCGIDCSGCPVGIATETGDEDYFRKMAEQWGTLPLNLKCTGCKTEMISASCVSCSKRNCAMKKQLDSCSLCPEYPCSYFRRRAPEIT